MRACARVALASIAVSASFSLWGCAAIEELKETFLRWVESEKLPSGRGVSADELPEATPVVPPEKTPKEPSKRHPRPKDAVRRQNPSQMTFAHDQDVIQAVTAEGADQAFAREISVRLVGRESPSPALDV
jgi:hypothetical protein